MQGQCDVCGVETETVGMKSVFGDVDFDICEDCMSQGLEPYSVIMEAQIKNGLESYSPAVQTFAKQALDILERRMQGNGT